MMCDTYMYVNYQCGWCLKEYIVYVHVIFKKLLSHCCNIYVACCMLLWLQMHMFWVISLWQAHYILMDANVVYPKLKMISGLFRPPTLQHMHPDGMGSEDHRCTHVHPKGNLHPDPQKWKLSEMSLPPHLSRLIRPEMTDTKSVRPKLKMVMGQPKALTL